jgi:hypothetical protein
MFTRRARPFILLLCTATPVLAQEQPDPRTLIPQQTLNALAQHISGAQALHNVMEMCPYERNRPPEEYAGTYREAAYAEAKPGSTASLTSTSSGFRSGPGSGTARWRSCG